MKPDDFLRLSNAGLTPQQIALVMEIMTRETKEAADKEEARRAKGRERWHRWHNKREPNVSKREQTLANDSREGVERGLDNLQTKNQAGEKGKEEKSAPAALSSFPAFWSLYPNKVGKRDAETAFLKALKRADIETILSGLRRYAAKTDDRPWCNPATWLNQDRWDDAPAAVVPQPRATAPPGRRQNAVEALVAHRSRERQHEPSGPIVDHRDDELLPPDKPELRGLVGNLGQALRWPVGSGDH